MDANRAMALVAGLAIVVVALSGGCARNGFQAGGRAIAVHAPFDPGAWKADAPGARAGMAEDLLERRLLIGKSKAEVKALLGDPDQEGAEFLGYFVITAAGNARGQAYVVRVEFDARARAEDAHVDTDAGGQGFDMD